MERFVSQQNIERFRKLLDTCSDEPRRRLIFELLAEEQEKNSDERKIIKQYRPASIRM